MSKQFQGRSAEGLFSIKWTPERFDQARAMKFRWMFEDLKGEDQSSEFRLVYHDLMNQESAEDHLAFWLYTNHPDTFWSWTN